MLYLLKQPLAASCCGDGLWGLALAVRLGD